MKQEPDMMAIMMDLAGLAAILWVAAEALHKYAVLWICS